MINYCIRIQYDGTRYKGWQVQKNEENTIQGKLQNVLSRLMGMPVEVIGSGRTDAGVHAKGQVANFHLDEVLLRRKLDPEGKLSLEGRKLDDYLLFMLNTWLPEDIGVDRIDRRPERFHARYQAVSKTYRYRIDTGRSHTVFDRKYVYSYTDAELDPVLMKKAADNLLGTHDFTSFCGNSHMKKSAVRTLYSIEIEQVSDRETDLVFTGDGFLMNMVRILAGTLIEVGTGRRDPDSMADLLAAKDRSQAGYTAPAQGLVLDQVKYPDSCRPL